MGSLVHSRECGKSTAVSAPSSEADLVAESAKKWFQALEFTGSCTVVKCIVTAIEGAGARTHYPKNGSLAPPCADMVGTCPRLWITVYNFSRRFCSGMKFFPPPLREDLFVNSICSILAK